MYSTVQESMYVAGGGGGGVRESVKSMSGKWRKSGTRYVEVGSRKWVSPATIAWTSTSLTIWLTDNLTGD